LSPSTRPGRVRGRPRPRRGRQRWRSGRKPGRPEAGQAGSRAGRKPGRPEAGSRAGCLEVVVVGSDQHLHQISQTAPGNGWGAWTDLGGVGESFRLIGYEGEPAAIPVIGDNGNGCLEAYLVAGNNTVYRIRQQSPGGAWSGWALLGTPGLDLSSNPAIGTITHNDLLQLFVLGADGNIYHLSQRGNSTW
jgi:hypothetical protein